MKRKGGESSSSFSSVPKVPRYGDANSEEEPARDVMLTVKVAEESFRLHVTERLRNASVLIDKLVEDEQRKEKMAKWELTIPVNHNTFPCFDPQADVVEGALHYVCFLAGLDQLPFYVDTRGTSEKVMKMWFTLHHLHDFLQFDEHLLPKIPPIEAFISSFPLSVTRLDTSQAQVARNIAENLDSYTFLQNFHRLSDDEKLDVERGMCVMHSSALNLFDVDVIEKMWLRYRLSSTGRTPCYCDDHRESLSPIVSKPVDSTQFTESSHGFLSMSSFEEAPLSHVYRMAGDLRGLISTEFSTCEFLLLFSFEAKDVGDYFFDLFQKMNLSFFKVTEREYVDYVLPQKRFRLRIGHPFSLNPYYFLASTITTPHLQAILRPRCWHLNCSRRFLLEASNRSLPPTSLSQVFWEGDSETTVTAHGIDVNTNISDYKVLPDFDDGYLREDLTWRHLYGHFFIASERDRASQTVKPLFFEVNMIHDEIDNRCAKSVKKLVMLLQLIQSRKDDPVPAWKRPLKVKKPLASKVEFFCLITKRCSSLDVEFMSSEIFFQQSYSAIRYSNPITFNDALPQCC